MIQHTFQFALRFYQRRLSWDHRWRYAVGGRRVCRFYPSCSDYAIKAIDRYGVARGSWLSFRRLLRCNPFHSGGVDEV